MQEKFTLSELNGQVKRVLTNSFTAPVWVVGEIAEINIQSSGHCYLTLIEKGGADERIIAQARATIWSYTFRMLRPYFETTTGQPLTDGLKILVQVSVEFHEMYGFSLNIRNIDPVYTLGDQARKRREIIQRLTDEGVITMNKELELPLAPQRIAIISSPTAAGYEDFMTHLKQNPEGYCFYTRLFPAVMQGNQSEQSIMDALDRIYPYEDFFDMVVIIRGGGSQVDLSCFDNYDVAYHVTQFPLPVLTGIGHEKDDSIVDLVAHTRLKTPTAVAEFLLEGLRSFESNVGAMEQEILALVENRIREERDKLEDLAGDLSQLTRNLLVKRRNELMHHSWKFQQEIKLTLQKQGHQLGKKLQRMEHLVNHYLFVQHQKIAKAQELPKVTVPRQLMIRTHKLNEYLNQCKFLIDSKIKREYYQLDMAGQQAKLSDPQNILLKGYSITTSGGKLVRSIAELKGGEELKTRLHDGSVVSKILNINKNHRDDS